MVNLTDFNNLISKRIACDCAYHTVLYRSIILVSGGLLVNSRTTESRTGQLANWTTRGLVKVPILSIATLTLTTQ